MYRYQHQGNQTENEKRLEVLLCPKVLEPNIGFFVCLFVFNGIKIYFYCSRLFLVLMFLNVPAANWDIKEFYHLIPTMFSTILPCWMKDTMILAQSHSHLKNRLPAVRFTGINFSDVIFFFPQCYPPCSSFM